MSASEPRVGCGAAIFIGGRLLLIQRRTAPEAGHWGPPGGKVDLFEPAADATAREIREELGIEIAPCDLLCIVDQIDRDVPHHWLCVAYLIESFVGEPQLCEPHKHSALGWFPLDDLPAPLTAPTHGAVDAIRKRQALQSPARAREA